MKGRSLQVIETLDRVRRYVGGIELRSVMGNPLVDPAPPSLGDVRVEASPAPRDPGVRLRRGEAKSSLGQQSFDRLAHREECVVSKEADPRGSSRQGYRTRSGHQESTRSELRATVAGPTLRVSVGNRGCSVAIHENHVVLSQRRGRERTGRHDESIESPVGEDVGIGASQGRTRGLSLSRTRPAGWDSLRHSW